MKKWILIVLLFQIFLFSIGILQVQLDLALSSVADGLTS